jgi:hypothetical protein
VKLSVVVLTMGNRPEELARAVRSALEQEHVDVEVVLVGNGVDPVGGRAAAAPFDDERDGDRQHADRDGGVGAGQGVDERGGEDQQGQLDGADDAVEAEHGRGLPGERDAGGAGPQRPLAA